MFFCLWQRLGDRMLRWKAVYKDVSFCLTCFHHTLTSVVQLYRESPPLSQGHLAHSESFRIWELLWVLLHHLLKYRKPPFFSFWWRVFIGYIVTTPTLSGVCMVVQMYHSDCHRIYPTIRWFSWGSRWPYTTETVESTPYLGVRHSIPAADYKLKMYPGKMHGTNRDKDIKTVSLRGI